MVVKMTPETCKMARVGLDLGIRDLASLAICSTQTVLRFEKGGLLKPRTILALQAALEAQGAIFLTDEGEGAGVRVPAQPRPARETPHDE